MNTLKLNVEYQVSSIFFQLTHKNTHMQLRYHKIHTRPSERRELPAYSTIILFLYTYNIRFNFTDFYFIFYCIIFRLDIFLLCSKRMKDNNIEQKNGTICWRYLFKFMQVSRIRLLYHWCCSTKQSNLCITMINNDYIIVKRVVCASDSLDHFSDIVWRNFVMKARNFSLFFLYFLWKCTRNWRNWMRTHTKQDYFDAVLLFSFFVVFVCVCVLKKI